MNHGEKQHGISDNPLVQADSLRATWVDDSVKFMEDKDFGEVLDMAVRMMTGDIPENAKIARVCVRLEAYALKFRMQYSGYMSYMKATDQANMKKNHYKELYTGIDRLVDSLKYMVK